MFARPKSGSQPCFTEIIPVVENCPFFVQDTYIIAAICQNAKMFSVCGEGSPPCLRYLFRYILCNPCNFLVYPRCVAVSVIRLLMSPRQRGRPPVKKHQGCTLTGTALKSFPFLLSLSGSPLASVTKGFFHSSPFLPNFPNFTTFLPAFNPCSGSA